MARRPDEVTELSELARERELKRQRKEAIEAKERAAQERSEKEKRERVLQEEENFEAERRERKARRDTDLASEEFEDDEEVSSENKQRGGFTDDVSGNLGGKSHTDKLKAHYKNPDLNKVEEEALEDNEEQDNAPRARKNLGRKEKEMRVRSGGPVAKNKNAVDNHEPDEDVFDEEESFADDVLGMNRDLRKPDAEAGAREAFEDFSYDETDADAPAGVASLAEARKVREIQRVLEEENDPGLDEATENAEIISFMFMNEKKVSCKFDDFFDQTIVFTSNDPGLDETAEVQLDLSFNYLKKEAKLNFKGKVTETQDDGEGNKFVTVEIPEESVRAFDAFMKLYQVRQKNIDFFLKKVKGL